MITKSVYCNYRCNNSQELFTVTMPEVTVPNKLCINRRDTHLFHTAENLFVISKEFLSALRWGMDTEAEKKRENKSVPFRPINDFESVISSFCLRGNLVWNYIRWMFFFSAILLLMNSFEKERYIEELLDIINLPSFIFYVQFKYRARSKLCTYTSIDEICSEWRGQGEKETYRIYSKFSLHS